MASRQPLVALVAFALSLAACTEPNTQTTLPPDVFAPTPSIEGEPVPTTRPPPPDIDKVEIFPVDPRTLEALPGFLPMPMGDWTSGVSSPNGQWLALYYGDDTGFNNGTRLVDVLAWEMAADWTAEDLQPVSVDDEGTVLAVDYRGTSPALARLAVGQERSEPIAELPTNFNVWDRPRSMDDGRLLLTGPVFDETGAGHLEIVVVDESTGAVVENALPDVPFGAADFIEFEDGRSGVVDVMSTMVWDDSNERVLVVHAGADVVTEVDLASGKTTDHRFGPMTGALDEPSPPPAPNSYDLWTSTRRSAATSPDGRMLYIAGQVGEFIDREGVATSVITPTGLIAIDTGTWEVVDRLDAALSELFLSPDGSRLIATGYYFESSETNNVSESSGLHLIDPLGLEVISHHEPERPELYYGPVSFSPDGGLGYVTTWVDMASVVVIDLNTGDQIASRAGDRVLVFGEVGVMADSAQRDG